MITLEIQRFPMDVEEMKSLDMDPIAIEKEIYKGALHDAILCLPEDPEKAKSILNSAWDLYQG